MTDNQKKEISCPCGKKADENNQHSLCYDCWCEAYFCCESCDTEISVDQVKEGVGEGWYCEECWNEDFFKCAWCNIAFKRDDEFFSSIAEETYCRDCYNDRFFVCEGCDTEFNNDDYAEDGRCNGCCVGNDDDNEWGSDFQPQPIFCSTTHKGLASARPFGIELECSSACYFDTVPWGHVHDGSLPSRGREFVSPVLQGDDGLSALAIFCEKLKKNDAEINSDCGFHLHVEVRDHSWYDVHKLLLIYEKLEAILFQTQPVSRQKNGFCIKLEGIPFFINKSALVQYIYGTKAARNRSKYEGKRYYWVNIKPWIDGRGTIEIRLHAGTISYQKISNWVKLHIAIVEYVHKTPWSELRQLSPESILNIALKNYPEVIVYYNERSEKFTGDLVLRKEVA